MRRIRENADFEADLKGPKQTSQGTLVSKKGAAGMPGRKNQNARYGDNAMNDQDEPKKLNEDAEQGVIERLHELLRDQANVTDEEIKAGIHLTRQGFEKIAAHFGLAVDQVKALLSSLCTMLRAEDQIAESYRRTMETLRYSAETDLNGNTIVSDSKTGEKKTLIGSDGARLSKKLGNKDPHEQQHEMQKLFELTEDEELHTVQDEKMPFADEINAGGGTFNFSGKLHGKPVFGTASFRDDDGVPDVKVLVATNGDGEEINLKNPRIMAALHRVAVDFMGDA